MFPAYQHLAQWIALCLKFKDPETPKKTASRKALWLALSVYHEAADMVAEDIQLGFARGAPSFFDMPGQRKRCGAHRGHVQDRRFTKLSESRWVTLAPVSFIRSEVGRSHIIWVVLQDS